MSDDSELLKLASSIVLIDQPSTENNNAKSNKWKKIHGGVFVTAYNHTTDFTSENVWCCMSNGEYNGLQSVWDNTKSSANICKTRDSRTMNNGEPKIIHVTILKPKNGWRRIPYDSLLSMMSADRYRAIQLNINKQSAFYLPSVWKENPTWSIWDLLKSLGRKATGRNITLHDLRESMVWEVDCYEIEEKGRDYGFFDNNKAKEIEKTERPATHSGTWYLSNRRLLQQEMNNWTENLPSNNKTVHGIIVPHAGYQYSGRTAAYAYNYLKGNDFIKTVFILGPSHFADIGSKCNISPFKSFETPFGKLERDETVVDKLLSSSKYFQLATEDVDKTEHSLEMQFPWISWCFSDVKIVPILVPGLDEKQMNAIADMIRGVKNSLVIVSSDFCHWGERFDYMPFESSKTSKNISTYIEKLDREGIEFINQNDISGFKKYLKRTGNTICGKYAILLMMYIFRRQESQLLHYTQSNSIQTVPPTNESSVSYASIIKT